MSARARLAVCAVVATLAAASALLPLVRPGTWMLHAAGLLVVQAAVGAAARMVPLPRPVTVLVQALVSLLLLTGFFAAKAAVGGLLPGPEVFSRFGELLGDGVQDVGRYAIPAPVTGGIRLLLLGGVLVVGLAVDALAVTWRSAAPAGLPLLALYSIAAGLGKPGASWLWFLCAAAGYLLLLLAEGRQRVARWGRTFPRPDGAGPRGGPPDEATAGPPGPVAGLAPVRTGRRIGALTLGIAVLVPAVLPSLNGGLLTPGNREGSPDQDTGGTVSAVNPLVALQDSLNQPQNRTALTYSTSSRDTDGSYLRIVALDRFDGSSWRPAQRRIGEVPDPLPAPRGLSPQVRTERVRTDVRAAGWYAQNWLPMPYPAERVAIGGRWRFEPAGRTLVGDRGQTTRGARYRVDSRQVRPTARQLAAAPPAPRELAREYTRVPDSLPSLVRREARRVTRGAANDYERAVRLQNWFAQHGGFRYDTKVSSGSGSAAIGNFLERKEGFCVHFAFSMAAMARTLGIPARVAVGFTPGTPQGNGRMAVGLRDAHAWPELYFEGAGWTRFEPTPQRGSAPSYTRPSAAGQQQSPGPALPDQDTGGTTANPAPNDSCAARNEQDEQACGTAAPTSEGGFPLGAAAAGVAAAGLLVLALPRLLRERLRRRRLHPHTAAPWDRAVLDGWRELLDCGRDYGIPPHRAATPRQAAARLVHAGELAPDAAAAAHRMADRVEHVRYAPPAASSSATPPGPDPQLAADVRLVRAGLHSAAPRALRVRARLLPPSTARMPQALTQRWATLRRARGPVPQHHPTANYREHPQG